MKKFILIALPVLFTAALCAQQKFAQGSMNINGDTYTVWYSDMFPTIGAYNASKNIEDFPRLKKGQQPLPIPYENIHVDTVFIRTLILDILKDRRPALEANDDYISMNYIFYPENEGRIMNINYSLPNNTRITPEELDRIDRILRKKVRIRLTGEEYKAFPAVHYTRQRKIYFRWFSDR